MNNALMDINLNNFAKKHDYLVCVDSDGCAMDTMDIKHFKCFGPCMVAEWGLEEWAEPILKRWNDLNMYTMTRGINRFKGLQLALIEINEQYKKIEDLETLVHWVDTSKALGNGALEEAIAANPASVSLPKALAWSKAVNASIEEIPMSEKKPYEGVAEALALAHQTCDVAIVSSANLGAVVDEWDLYGLLDSVDIICAQDAGSKAYCIGELAKKGYDKANILMCGDAPGDKAAAEKNEVAYFPILVKHEKECWDQFAAALAKLQSGTYAGEYQDERNKAFLDNLS